MVPTGTMHINRDCCGHTGYGMMLPAGIYFMLVSLPAGICAIFGVFKLWHKKKLFDPCWDRRPVMKYVKQLHQCHSSSIQSFELLFSNVGGVPDFFCYLGAHAKIWNPATTPSGILVTAARVRRLIPKIVAYISCSVGRTHFARTN